MNLFLMTLGVALMGFAQFPPWELPNWQAVFGLGAGTFFSAYMIALWRCLLQRFGK
ncbi:hypothetical protein [Dinoroseobacter sp. S124A]|uniref:hypothetical protein n=1 Tax=Dinoroseobacter sp. S124A TaxID=3415128 RepID=UPI003C7B602A